MNKIDAPQPWQAIVQRFYSIQIVVILKDKFGITERQIRSYEFINDILGEYSMMNDVMERLLNEGSSSIAYRIKKEIMQEKLSKEEEQNYLDLIYAEPKVQMVLAWQNKDGYFGTRLHTAPSGSKVWTHEGCVRYLLEMGLTNECEEVRKALEVMTYPGWEKECENSRAAQVIKYEMIRASLYAQAGCKNDEIISKWVNDALIGFQNIAEAQVYEDIVYENKNHKLIFKGDKYIPVIYHLRILAYTESWRTKENLEMLRTAYDKLYQWLPLPPMYYKSKGQLIAPLGNICGPVNQNFKDEYGFLWFHFYELSARMGMLDFNSPFRKHFEEMKKSIWEYGDKANELQIKRKNVYTGWSGYIVLIISITVEHLFVKCFQISPLQSSLYLVYFALVKHYYFGLQVTYERHLLMAHNLQSRTLCVKCRMNRELSYGRKAVLKEEVSLRYKVRIPLLHIC